MSVKPIETNINILWVKTILYAFILVLVIVSVILIPKVIFKRDAATTYAISLASTDDVNLLLYDYDVYATTTRFNEGLIAAVDIVKQAFDERNEVLAIKVYGETKTIERRNDYIYITDPNTLMLNIEYYLVKDVALNDITIPARTFIMLFDDIAPIINGIYIGLYTIVFISIFTPFTIKVTRQSLYLYNYYQTEKSE